MLGSLILFLELEPLRSTVLSVPQSADEVVTCEKSRASVSPRSSFAAQMGEDGREMPMGRKEERVAAAKKSCTPACLATFLGRTDQILNFKFNGEPNPTPKTKQVVF